MIDRLVWPKTKLGTNPFSLSDGENIVLFIYGGGMNATCSLTITLMSNEVEYMHGRIDKSDKSMQSMDETLHDIFLEVSSSSSTLGTGTNSVHTPRAKNRKHFQMKNLRKDSFDYSAAMTNRSTYNATKASKTRVSFAKVEMHQHETALEGEKHISQAGAQGPATCSRSDYESKGTNEPESRIEHVEKE